eukprot:5753913-Prymnesium_polylepis.2
MLACYRTSRPHRVYMTRGRGLDGLRASHMARNFLLWAGGSKCDKVVSRVIAKKRVGPVSTPLSPDGPARANHCTRGCP